MNYLFVHQNFPGQFKYLAPALSHNKDNRVVGFSMNGHPGDDTLQVINYKPSHGNGKDTHNLVKEFESKVIRGEAAFNAANKLKQTGFYPQVIIAHPGWGESLFLKDVWPRSKLAIYCEFYYQSEGSDVGFDSEFPDTSPNKACLLRMKNVNNNVHLAMADAGISPTRWQAGTFPADFMSKISVIHDGVQTSRVIPLPSSYIIINGKLKLDTNNEIITFVNRNLEPYRGYHIFMRSLPRILRERPNAHVVIVGGDSVSYGRAAPDGKSWKNIFLNEVKEKIDLSRVHFVGNLSYKNYLSVLQVSTVHVYLTYPFVLSWSLLEAMSAGCAIVASDTGPVREVIEHGKNGYLVNFFDHHTLSEEVVRLVKNPKLRSELGTTARNFVVNNYDLKTICLPQQIAWAESLI